MSSQRNTGAFIIGGVLGGLAGAAVTLWNTPKSGDELRAMLSGGSSTSHDVTSAGGDERSSKTATGGRFSNPVLSFVERAAAPIVGVELGKLAKDDPDSSRHAPVRASAADAKPPTPHRGNERVEDASLSVTDVRTLEEAETHDDNAGSSAHAATVEELTTPPPDEAATHSRGSATESEHKPADFPDLTFDKTS